MIILASGSPRRHQLLSRLGLEFEVSPSGVPEDDVEGHPLQIASRLASRKARASAGGDDQVILAADTVLDVDGQLVGKPADAVDAVRMLRDLRGRQHSVITALAIRSGTRCQVSAVETRVLMRNYSDAEISAYVDSGEPLDKAGAYAIQGRGGKLVEQIRGCYLNVVGLPLCEVRTLMESFGIHLAAGLCSRIGGVPCPREG